MKNMNDYIQKIIVNNDDHCQAIAQLLMLLDKNKAHSLVLNYKQNTKLPEIKVILVDEILTGLKGLLDIHPHQIGI